MSWLDGLSGLFGSAAYDYPFVFIFVGAILFLVCSINLFNIINAIFARVGGWK